MDALPVLLIAAVVAGAYALFMSRSDASVAARRLARRTRNVAIAAVKPGERVKVTGVVSALDPPINSPIDNVSCVGFRVVAIAHMSQGGARQAPTSRPGQMAEQTACVRFAIADETGIARVEGPFTVGLDLEGEWSIPITTFDLLRRAEMPDFSLFGAWAFSYREGLLLPGERVSLVGRAFIEQDPAAGSLPGRTPPTIVCLRGSADEPIVVVDIRR
ncbi:MAG TPA: hypothetical protein VIF57_31900 [Polyangia bacterium]